ncbi:hypothetical protein ACLMJK_003651 [Lecanora helva]
MISVGDSAEISKIYGITGKYKKSEFYPVIRQLAKGKAMPGLFNVLDEDLHRILKKPIASTYSMSNLVSFEPLVDSTMRVFFEELDRRFVQTDMICEFDAWLQMFAFDVMGEITFSKRLGFLERGEDVDGIMASIWNHFQYTAPVGQMPWLDNLLKKNPVLSRLQPERTNPMVSFARERMSERQNAEEEAKLPLNNRDFLSRFIEAEAKEKDLPPWALMSWTTSNITAGSDTTAILLRTIFYSLLKHPQDMERLMKELSTARDGGRLSNPVTWKETRDLPFLDACVKEAGRLHPPFGLQYERVVPEEGANICGQYVRGSTIVGINPWVAHRDEAIFGHDAQAWRPQRWLCDEKSRKSMEHSLLTFGAGHRSCIGKNISYLEVYKLVPTMLQLYDIEMHDPNATWEVQNSWFVVQKGFRVRLHRKK